MPQAEITATQTGLVRTTTSGPDGTYVLTGPPVVPYKLQVQASGLEAYTPALHVQLGRILPLRSRCDFKFFGRQTNDV
jgi:hypothetical protein